MRGLQAVAATRARHSVGAKSYVEEPENVEEKEERGKCSSG